MTQALAFAVLSLVTATAVAVAWAALARARSARADLIAAEAIETERTSLIDLARTREADSSRRITDVAHDLTDLLTGIIGQTEVLIASLDPSGASILDAYEIRRAAASAALLIKSLRGSSSGRSAADPGTTAPVGGHAVPGPHDVHTVAVVDRKPAVIVLVVEDEPGVRELITAILVRAGYEVVAAAGPRAALVTLRRGPTIALMLVDVVMPEMDGYDLVAEARTIVPGVKVVFMSAFAGDPKRHAGGDGFLAKPFSAESLSAIVADAIATPERGRPA